MEKYEPKLKKKDKVNKEITMTRKNLKLMLRMRNLKQIN